MAAIAPNQSFAQATAVFRQTAQTGAELAAAFERGQSITPIADQFNGLLQHLSSSPLSIGLVAADASSRAATLAYLCGDHYRVLAVSSISEAGQIEVTLQDRGFALERPDGSKLEFDRIEPFLEALRQSHVTPSENGGDWIDAIKLRLQDAPGLQGVRVISPQPLDRIDLPRLVGNLIPTTNVLMIAAGLQFTPDEKTATALTQLTSGAELVQPIVLGQITQETPPGWWKDSSLLRSASVLPAQCVGEPEGVPPTLLGDDILRQSLHLSQLTRGLFAAASLISERQENELRRIAAAQARCAREQRGIDESAKSQDLRFQLEPIRAEFQDDVAKLNNGLSEANRKAFLGDGTIQKIVAAICASITVDNLKRELAPKTIRLTVDNRCTEEAEATIRHCLRARLKEDLIMIRDGLELTRQRMEERLLSAYGSPVSMPLSLPEEQAIWGALEPLIHIDLKYKSELPRRTFMHRIMEGRRPVAMILMTLSVFTGAVPLVRRSLAFKLGVPLLFIGGVAHTFRAFREEYEERLEAEIERFHEGMESEVQEIIADVQREKLVRLGAQLTAVAKEASRKLDGIFREIADSRTDNSEQAKADLKLRLRSLETRAKLLQAQSLRVGKFLQSCAEVETAARKALGDVSKSQKAMTA